MDNIEHLNKEHAFKIVFDQFKNAVFGYAFRFFRSRELSEELVQDVFMKLWVNWDSLDATKNIKPYLFTIAKNTIYNKLKSFVVEQTYLNDVFYNYSMESNAVEELVQYRELKGIYDMAVAKLPAQRQRIFKLSREENMSHDEIAQELNISRNTVKDQMVKSLKFIRQYLETNAELTSLLMVFYHYMQKK